MLKYIAILQALHKSSLGLDPEQLKRAICITSKSPALDKDEYARKWIETTKKAYPEKYYLVRYCVISFEENEKNDVETMLNSLVKMFW